MIRRFVNSTDGTIAAMTAIMMTVLLGMTGLGIEVASWHTIKRSMQEAADAAAVTAAAGFTASPATYVAHAKAVAGFNGWQDGAGSVTVVVNKPPLNGNYTGSTDAIEVVISQTQPTFLAGAVGYGSSTTLRVHSVVSLPTKPPCITALSTQNNAIQINGNGVLSANNCTVTTKGNVNFSGNHSVLNAAGLTVGPTPPSQCTGNPTTQCNVPAGKVTQGSTSTPPHTYPAKPVVNASCTSLATGGPNYAPNTSTTSYCGGAIAGGSNFTLGTIYNFYGTSTISGGSVTFGSSGGGNVIAFDGGLTITNGTVTFNPGIYYIEGGSLSISGQATVTGTGVTFVFTTGTSVAGYATLNVSGSPNTTVNLAAPTSGSTKGVVFFGDPSAPAGTLTNSISGNGSVTLTGLTYFPTEGVSISGNGVTSSTCTELVAYTIVDTGNGAFSANGCQSYGLPGSTTITQLVE